MSEETTKAPAPGGDSQETKKQTVRISLPPKPAAAPTIKIAVPSAGAAKTADGGKAASTIKIPVPAKTAAPKVGITKPATATAAKEDSAKKTAEATAPAAEVEAPPVEAAAKAVKKKKAKVRKTAAADSVLDTAVAAVSAVGAIGLAFFLFTLGS
ncbi:MAG: hypothetical protein CMO57_04600 [Verrucomicrobiales bacterium]|jgi:hypothetical protein|nr:hypothetical protein [Verrucomicrobiales bacterium]